MLLICDKCCRYGLFVFNYTILYGSMLINSFNGIDEVFKNGMIDSIKAGSIGEMDILKKSVPSLQYEM